MVTDARDPRDALTARADLARTTVLETIRHLSTVVVHLARVTDGDIDAIHEAHRIMRIADALSNGLAITTGELVGVAADARVITDFGDELDRLDQVMSFLADYRSTLTDDTLRLPGTDRSTGS